MKYIIMLLASLFLSLGLNAQYAAKMTRLSSQTPTTGAYAIQAIFSSDEGFDINTIDALGDYYYIDNAGTEFQIVAISNVSAPIITFEFDNIPAETKSPDLGAEGMVATKNSTTNQYYISSNLSKGFTAKIQRLNVLVETEGDVTVSQLGDSISAIRDLVQVNNGNILYVNNTNGNNSTAVKGDPTRPWKDPWTAGAAASSGDVVYGYSSVWTPSSITNSLVYDEVHFHFDESVTFVQSGSIRALFQAEYCSGCVSAVPLNQGNIPGIQLKMTGQPTLKNIALFNYRNRLNKLDAFGTVVPIVQGDFELNEGSIADQQRNFIEIRGDNVDLNVKINKFDYTTNGGFLDVSRFGSQASEVMENVSVNVHVNAANIQMASSTQYWGGFFRQFTGGNRTYDSLSLYVRVDDVVIKDGHKPGDAGTILTLEQDNTFINSTLLFEFGKVLEYAIEGDSASVALGVLSPLYTDLAPTRKLIQLHANLVDSEVTINCNSCVSDITNIEYTGGHTGLSSNGLYSINGNYKSRYLPNIFIGDQGVGGTSTEVIYFNGKFIADSTESFRTLTNLGFNSVINLSGDYITNNSGTSVVATSLPLNLLGSRFNRAGSDVTTPYLISPINNTITVTDAHSLKSFAPLYSPNVTIDTFSRYDTPRESINMGNVAYVTTSANAATTPVIGSLKDKFTISTNLLSLNDPDLKWKLLAGTHSASGGYGKLTKFIDADLGSTFNKNSGFTFALSTTIPSYHKFDVLTSSSTMYTQPLGQKRLTLVGRQININSYFGNFEIGGIIADELNFRNGQCIYHQQDLLPANEMEVPNIVYDVNTMTVGGTGNNGNINITPAASNSVSGKYIFNIRNLYGIDVAAKAPVTKFEANNKVTSNQIVSVNIGSSKFYSIPTDRENFDTLTTNFSTFTKSNFGYQHILATNGGSSSSFTYKCDELRSNVLFLGVVPPYTGRQTTQASVDNLISVKIGRAIMDNAPILAFDPQDNSSGTLKFHADFAKGDHPLLNIKEGFNYTIYISGNYETTTNVSPIHSNSDLILTDTWVTSGGAYTVNSTSAITVFVRGGGNVTQANVGPNVTVVVQ